jgi:endonuclease/exonuclease/phosphatase (EEP) superfamily protein YafD
VFLLVLLVFLLVLFLLVLFSPLIISFSRTRALCCFSHAFFLPLPCFCPFVFSWGSLARMVSQLSCMHQTKAASTPLRFSSRPARILTSETK